MRFAANKAATMQMLKSRKMSSGGFAAMNMSMRLENKFRANMFDIGEDLEIDLDIGD